MRHCHWCGHKQAIVTVVERKGEYAVMTKVSNMTSDLVGSAIIQALKPVKAKVKALPYDNDKEFSMHAEIDKALGRMATLPGPMPVEIEAPTRTSMACCGNTCPRSARWQALQTRKLR
jgi:hypothetical protein